MARTYGIAVLMGAVALGAGAAQAADIARPAPVRPQPAVAPAFSWSGIYVGLQGGYNWGRATSAYDTPSPPFDVTIGPFTPKGWLAGGEAGFNHQFANRVVVGFEADVAFADITDTVPDLAGGPPFTITTKTDVVGSLRGRLGIGAGDGGRTLFYGTVGASWNHTTVSASDGPLSDQATLWGWTAGGGIEQAVGQRLSVKVEYLYSSFGSHTWFAGFPWASSGSSTSNTIRAGLNLRL